MPERTDTAQTRLEAYRALRARHEDLMALELDQFISWCGDVATMRVDSVSGLIDRLRRSATGYVRDRRVEALQRAEEAVVDQLDRYELAERLEARRLTGFQREYWYARRPREVSTVNGHPIWFAATLVDVVD